MFCNLKDPKNGLVSGQDGKLKSQQNSLLRFEEPKRAVEERCKGLRQSTKAKKKDEKDRKEEEESTPRTPRKFSF